MNTQSLQQKPHSVKTPLSASAVTLARIGKKQAKAVPTHFLTTEQLAGAVGLCPATIRILAKTGKISGAVKFGKRWRFPKNILPVEVV